MALFVGRTRNNTAVHVNLANSKAAEHISRNPHLVTLAAEVLGGTSVDGLHEELTFDMGRIVGYDFVVRQKSSDNVFYAQLLKGTTYIPFTKVDNPISTRLLTVELVRDSHESDFWLQNIYLGSPKPPLPGASDETAHSKVYWKQHVYIYGNQPIKANSITRNYPYV